MHERWVNSGRTWRAMVSTATIPVSQGLYCLNCVGQYSRTCSFCQYSTCALVAFICMRYVVSALRFWPISMFGSAKMCGQFCDEARLLWYAR